MRVAIVVDPSSSELDELSQEMPVWAVESIDNRTAAKQVWAQTPKRDLTLYKVQDLNAKDFNSFCIIDTIELHHPQITSVLIVGVSPGDSLAAQLLSVGYTLATEGGRLIGQRDPAKHLPY